MYAKKTIALNMSVFRVHSSRFIYKCSSATIVNITFTDVTLHNEHTAVLYDSKLVLSVDSASSCAQLSSESPAGKSCQKQESEMHWGLILLHQKICHHLPSHMTAWAWHYLQIL